MSTFVDWAVAGRALEDGEPNGDDAAVREDVDSVVLAVADGIGHGTCAHRAGSLVAETVRQEPLTDPVAVLRACDATLRGTRGAAVTVAVVERHGHLAWAGVGNVEGRIVRRARNLPTEALPVSPGIVGHGAAPPRAFPVDLEPGDVVLLASDGLRPEFADEAPRAGSCEAIARRVLHEHARGADDALVLVARYRGAEG